MRRERAVRGRASGQGLGVGGASTWSMLHAVPCVMLDVYGTCHVACSMPRRRGARCRSSGRLPTSTWSHSAIQACLDHRAHACCNRWYTLWRWHGSLGADASLHGACCVSYVACRILHGAWCMVHGACHMLHVACVPHGACCMLVACWLHVVRGLRLAASRRVRCCTWSFTGHMRHPMYRVFVACCARLVVHDCVL